VNRWFFILACIGFFIFVGLSSAQQQPGVTPGIIIPGQPTIYPGVTGMAAQQPSVQQAPALTTPTPAQTTQQPSIQKPIQQMPAQQQPTQQQIDMYKSLTPQQQMIIQQELGKSGGALTPEAIEALKSRQEFQGITPEDIIKGQQILEKKDTEKRLYEPTQLKVIEEKTKEEKSLFNRLRTFGQYQDISIDLKPFGYDFFKEAVIKVITDRKDIPVPSKYVIGPGDEVKILLWGRVNAQYNLIVDRNGNITIPQIGPVPVAGLTFEDMSKHLIKQAEQIIGANIDITMGALKSIPIFVLGDVKRPGAYTVGSFATITDALLIAGGPTDIGTMRNIQLKRGEKVVSTFDLYDLLLKGDKSKDVILMAGDVVFVPVAGPIVGIAGNVKRPAIYELKDKLDLYSLFELAGGIIPTAYTQQIQVERIVKNEKQIVVDINDKDLSASKEILLQDGDLIKIFSIVEKDVNVVFLYGNIKRPGKYEYKEGMRIRDLIRDESDLLPETHLDYALIKRLKPPSFEVSFLPINLKGLFSTKENIYNIELKPQDTVYVFSKWFFQPRPYITIEGEVRDVVLSNLNDMSFGVLKNLGIVNSESIDVEKVKMLGITDINSMKFSELRKFGVLDITNINLEDVKKVGISYIDNLKVGELIQRGVINAKNINLDEAKKFGIININDWKIGDLKKITKLEYLGINEAKLEIQKKFIEIPLKDNMTIRDAILSSGGLTKDAYIYEAELYRTDNVSKKISLHKINLKKALDGDKDSNIVLKDNDRIVVHSIWGYSYKKTVSIDGEILKPGSYEYAEGMTVKDLVFAAGNVLESAYLDNADISFQIIDKDNTAIIEHRSINLKKALEGDPNHNISLMPYSRVFIKKIPDWRKEQFVTIGGEVRFPGRYFIKKGEKLSSLIERAGGYTDKAYLRGAVFTRERVKELQKKTLEEMAIRLEKDLMSESSLRLSTAISQEEVLGIRAQQEGTAKLIDALKKTQATGRIQISLAHPRLLKGSEFDIELEDGDNLYIPAKNNVIFVAGAVTVPGSFLYNESYDHDMYINKAGGFTKYADTKNMFILKVDGSAIKIPSRFITWSNANERWELTAFGEERKMLEPGDTIVVPEKLEAIAWMRSIRDITQILMQMAITGGQLKYIYKRD